MDVGDVDIVVQYKATCNFCSLWQRFGHVARSPGAQGIGILLVEKKDIVQGTKGRSVGCKRTSHDSQEGRRQRPRTEVASIEDNVDSLMAVQALLISSDLISEPSEATWSHQSEHKYARPEIAPKDPTNAKKGRAPGVLPGSALDDYINLPSYIPCRRRVPQLYFANNK
jgi:hypothetical protein